MGEGDHGRRVLPLATPLASQGGGKCVSLAGRLKGRASEHFNHALALLDQLHDARQARLQPCAQGLV